MKGHRRRGLVLAALLLATACGRAPRGWTPVLEETSTSYLDAEVKRTLDRVSAVRHRIPTDPDGALELLEKVEGGMRSLGDVFPELEGIEERVTDARLELRARSPRATGALRDLAESLERFVAKADLFL